MKLQKINLHFMRFFLLTSTLLLCLKMACAQIYVSEFMADNVNGIKDENDTRQDWIELYNAGAAAVNLNGWWLTDDLSNTAKWQLPSVSLGAGNTMIIWASGKNRRVSGQPLHTNFSLAKSGEYLGLYKPAPITGLPALMDEYGPTFPAQASDVSYGKTFATTSTTILAAGTEGKYFVPTSATQYSGTNYAAGELGHGDINGWNRSLSFNDSGWTTCSSGIGYDANGLLSSLVSTNVQSQLRNINPSILFRVKFNIPNPSLYTSFKLKMKYEDGCAVFLNGNYTAVASHAAPAVLAFNSLSSSNAASTTWAQWWETVIPSSSMIAGDNFLAIQGMNSSIGSSDFLILPVIEAVTLSAPGSPGYFSLSTPSASNGTPSSGPILFAATPEDPGIPRPTGNASSPALTVSCKVIKTAQNISQVRVIPRIMYHSEMAAITLLDNGVAPDLIAADGIYTGTIPTSAVGPAAMLRWRFEAQDAVGTIAKLPAFLDALDAPKYFGTVAQSSLAANSQIVPFEWFVGMQAEQSTAAGTVTTAGNARMTITSTLIPSSPLTIDFAVALNDNSSTIASKARAALNANATIKSRFLIKGSGSAIALIYLPDSTNQGPDSTLNIALANFTSAGIANSATSADVTSTYVGNGSIFEPYRGSLYYLGNFYDNIGHKIHGQSTAGFAKKSYDFDSNSGYRFLWKEGETRSKDLNLLSNYADKTKTRNTVSHDVGRMMGTPYHHANPVRVHLNGVFHGVMDLLEDGDDRFLERNQLDPEGAFYKIYSENMTSSVEKKTRLDETNTDLANLANGLLNTNTLAARRTFAYDNVNIPATVNYLVTRQLNSDGDHGHKNYYLYRNSNTTGEWQPIVWDVDLTQGHQWNGNNGTGGYFNDNMITDNQFFTHSANNNLYNLILESPEFQEMFARRMRTAMDALLGPPGSANGYIQNKMSEIVALIDPDPTNPSPLTDGDLDRAKWGNGFSIDNRPREEVTRVFTSYFPQRRTFLYDQTPTRPLVRKSIVTTGTPIPNNPQDAGVGSIIIDVIDYFPSSESQNSEYIILKNTSSEAIDLTGWKLTGAIDHIFTPGTVIPAGAGTAEVEYKGLLHIVKNAAAFRARTSGPRGGEKRLIQGNYSGQLSSRGELLTLSNASDEIISSFTYQGNLTTAQLQLRISEINYNPAPPTVNELAALPGINNDDFEFIEIVNTGNNSIDLTNMSFTAGVAYTFPPSSIAANARVVVAKNPSAFLLRHPNFIGLLGGYDDNLSNSGERIELTESSGEVVTDFSYNDTWYPITDAGGYSLVLRMTSTLDSAMGSSTCWCMSPSINGSPGSADVFAVITISDLTKTYTGTAQQATVSTTPTNLPITITYDNSSIAPTAIGSYNVIVSLTAPNYLGSASATMVIEKITQTINFPPLADFPLDGVSLNLSASSSSGLPVSFSLLNGSANLAGNAITPSSSGIITIRASQTGDSFFLPANNIERTVTVTRSYNNSLWRKTSFSSTQLLDELISGDQADPDGDDFSNLIEYATKTNPLVSNRASPPVIVSKVAHADQFYQALSYRRRVANLEIEMNAEISQNLATWNQDSPHTILLNTPVNNGDGTETVSYRSTQPFGILNKEFLRLRVKINP